MKTLSHRSQARHKGKTMSVGELNVILINTDEKSHTHTITNIFSHTITSQSTHTHQLHTTSLNNGYVWMCQMLTFTIRSVT